MRQEQKKLNRDEILDILSSYKKRITTELETILNGIHVPELIPTEDQLNMYDDMSVIYSSMNGIYLHTTILYNSILIEIDEEASSIIISDRLDKRFYAFIDDYEWVSNILIYVVGFMHVYMRKQIREGLETLCENKNHQ